jgi:hypothetical protein
VIKLYKCQIWNRITNVDEKHHTVLDIAFFPVLYEKWNAFSRRRFLPNGDRHDTFISALWPLRAICGWSTCLLTHSQNTFPIFPIFRKSRAYGQYSGNRTWCMLIHCGKTQSQQCERRHNNFESKWGTYARNWNQCWNSGSGHRITYFSCTLSLKITKLDHAWKKSVILCTCIKGVA